MSIAIIGINSFRSCPECRPSWARMDQRVEEVPAALPCRVAGVRQANALKFMSVRPGARRPRPTGSPARQTAPQPNGLVNRGHEGFSRLPDSRKPQLRRYRKNGKVGLETLDR